MTLRKRIFPRRVRDFVFVAFLMVVIHIAYWFGMFIVLPFVHPHFSLGYVFHVLLATFMLINTTSNWMYLVLTDTSVQQAVDPKIADPKTWRFCYVCDIYIPPRSWHCTICNTCILRRDHHCEFTGCCVGYKNYRYFLMFLVSFAFSAVYMLAFNTYFLVNKIELKNYLSRPFALVVLLVTSPFDIHKELSAEDLYVLFYSLNLHGVAIFLVLLWMHGTSIIRGLVIFEVLNKIYDYDLGSVKLNLIQVLGKRWYLTWISPLVYSELPSDGVKWITRECKAVKKM